uniref:Bulb-type lectin domain-containing protein n=1 Tax=candidate division WOR-3 bacterium TaxID=2052148 RepID=A0A7C4YF40_UNCW3
MRNFNFRFFILNISLFCESLIASPNTLWTKTFGGTGNDYAYSVLQTFDGSYIIAGYTESFGAVNTDIYLIKTDINGNLIWQKTFGGYGSDYAHFIEQSNDSCYIILGSTTSYGSGGSDIYLIKTDTAGNLIWGKTFGGENDDGGWSVQKTSDGGYIIAGSTNSFGAGDVDMYLLKTDEYGNFLWDKTFGDTSRSDYARSVVQTADGGYIIAGLTISFGTGTYDVYLVKTDEYGNLLWEKTFGGSNTDMGFSVKQTKDGGYIIGGNSLSFGSGDYDFYLIKTDSFGNLVWQRNLGGTKNDFGRAVIEDANGDYIIAGFTNSFGNGEYDIYICKYDTAGNIIWEKTYGMSGGDWCYSIQKTDDNGFILAGFTNSTGAGEADVYLVKTEPDVGVEEK